MGHASQTRRLVQVDPLAAGIVVLAVATALIHLLLGISLGPPSVRPFPLSFHLNALGYLVLVIALYAPQFLPVRRAVRWVFIAYAVLTIVLWIFISPDRDLVGYVDKVIEVLLVLLLIVDDRRSGRGVEVGRTA